MRKPHMLTPLLTPAEINSHRLLLLQQVCLPAKLTMLVRKAILTMQPTCWKTTQCADGFLEGRGYEFVSCYGRSGSCSQWRARCQGRLPQKTELIFGLRC